MNQGKQQRLLEASVAKVRQEFADQVQIVAVEFHRDSIGLDAPTLSIWYIVEDPASEDALCESELGKKVDSRTRDHLGISGYIRETGETVSVHIATRQSFIDCYTYNG